MQACLLQQSLQECPMVANVALRRRRCKRRFAKPRKECFEDGIGPSPKEECTYTDELQRDSRSQPSLDGSKGWWELLNVGVNLLDQGISFVVLTGFGRHSCHVQILALHVSSGNSDEKLRRKGPFVGSSWFAKFGCVIVPWPGWWFCRPERRENNENCIPHHSSNSFTTCHHLCSSHGPRKNCNMTSESARHPRRPVWTAHRHALLLKMCFFFGHLETMPNIKLDHFH